MRSILNMVLISFSCYPTCARLWYVISSEMQWRETGHDALRCVRRIVLLNAGLAVHARIHMHDWYGARVLSMFECPDDRTAKFSGAIRPARQLVSPEAACDRLVGHRSQDSVAERPMVA